MSATECACCRDVEQLSGGEVLSRWLIDDVPGIRRMCSSAYNGHASATGDADFAALLEALEAASPEFRALWPCHEVLAEQLGTKTIEHPRLGTSGCTTSNRRPPATRISA